MKRKLFILVLTLILVALLFQVAMAGAVIPTPGNKLDTAVQAQLNTLASGAAMTVIVKLTEQQNLNQLIGVGEALQQEGIIRALQAKAEASQKPILAYLAAQAGEGKVNHVVSFWIFNGLSVTATADVIQALAARPDVQTITADAITIVPQANPSSTVPEANISLIQAPELWNLGFSGQGVVVANMDSGVDVNHPDLASRWRGGSNSWYDPYNQHPTTPTDMSGHGTWSMGVMVGGEAGGTAVGIAPQAQWIAVKIFNDSGTATATAIHQGFQWLLDPDGNPNTTDAPRVVNNSWAYGVPGCNLEFQPDLQALRAVGILPVFAAGNYGPNTNSSVSPANYPEALAVGAANNSDLIYVYSSRGPSTCGQSTAVYPQLVAPGVNINTTSLFGLYEQVSGTSLAAPHVAGALALLLSAYPNLSVGQQGVALLGTAVDLGNPGPDNTFGYGRLNVLAAYQWLAAGGSTPTPTVPAPTPTNTPLPTATPVPTPATMHSGDLDGAAVSAPKNRWNATVTMMVHSAGEQVVSGVTIAGTWSQGASGSGSCVTGSNGRCNISKTNLSQNTTTVTFTINNLSKNGLTYTATANHDPDGDSNGTQIVIHKP